MKNILAALFAGCLGISIAAVGVVVSSSSDAAPVKKKMVRANDDGSDVIDAAIARQLAAAKARVSASHSEEIAFARVRR